MNRLPQTLGRKERMKSRKRIDALFDQGRKMQQFPFRILYITGRPHPGTTNSFPVQAGFTASSRNFPSAVDRNYLKRRMRETWRTQKAPLVEAALKTGTRIELFLIYTGREIADSMVVQHSLTALIRKLAHELNENFSLSA